MYPENILSHNWLIKRLTNRKVLSQLHRLSGTVLDLGCGLRPFEGDILQHANAYIGLDWSKTLHELKADVIANLNQPLPLCDAIVDHVVSFEVLEHLAEPGVMLREACRVMRPGGLLLLTVPFQWWLHEAPWDYQRYTRYGLEYQLRKAGFQNIVVEPTTGFWTMWLLKLNYQLARLQRGPPWLRLLVRLFLVPIWWLSQTVAQIFDRIWREDRETAGYFVMAQKS
jgi:SAM-dependent methyltransferase